MKSIKKNLIAFVLVSFISILPLISFAQAKSPAPCKATDGKICNPIGETTITGFIVAILEGVIKIAIPVVVLALIYAGFLFVAARGNPEELSKAKSALMYTIIGTGILLGSMALAELIQSTVVSLGN